MMELVALSFYLGGAIGQSKVDLDPSRYQGKKLRSTTQATQLSLSAGYRSAHI